MHGINDFYTYFFARSGYYIDVYLSVDKNPGLRSNIT